MAAGVRGAGRGREPCQRERRRLVLLLGDGAAGAPVRAGTPSLV